MAHFVSNFVAKATSVGRGRICVTSLNSPTPKPRAGRKALRDVSYSSRVVDDFVSNVVVIATGVVRRRSFLASVNSPTPKNPRYTQRSPKYLVHKPSYGRFCPKFRCHGNRGWSQ